MNPEQYLHARRSALSEVANLTNEANLAPDDIVLIMAVKGSHLWSSLVMTVAGEHVDCDDIAAVVSKPEAKAFMLGNPDRRALLEYYQKDPHSAQVGALSGLLVVVSTPTGFFAAKVPVGSRLQAQPANHGPVGLVDLTVFSAAELETLLPDHQPKNDEEHETLGPLPGAAEADQFAQSMVPKLAFVAQEAEQKGMAVEDLVFVLLSPSSIVFAPLVHALAPDHPEWQNVLLIVRRDAAADFLDQIRLGTVYVGGPPPPELLERPAAGVTSIVLHGPTVAVRQLELPSDDDDALAPESVGVVDATKYSFGTPPGQLN